MPEQQQPNPAQQEARQNRLTKLTAVWAGRDSKGNFMLSGKLGDQLLVILFNEFKQEDRQPDYIVYTAKPEARQDLQQNQPQRPVRPSPQVQGGRTPAPQQSERVNPEFYGGQLQEGWSNNEPFGDD